jgi:hypothetical protein
MNKNIINVPTNKINCKLIKSDSLGNYNINNKKTI